MRIRKNIVDSRAAARNRPMKAYVVFMNAMNNDERRHMNTINTKSWIAVRSWMLTATSKLRVAEQQMLRAISTDKKYTGTVATIDLRDHRLNVKGWTMRQKTFHLGDNCACFQLGKSDATLSDLRPGERVQVRYLKAQGVRIAVRVEQQAMRLEGIVRMMDAENRSLTLHQNALDHQLRLADDCQIVLRDGKSGGLADIEVGSHVTVTYELPDNMPTARRIDQTSITFVGRLTAIDIDDKVIKAKALATAKKFNLANNCTIVIDGKPDARLMDLTPMDKLVISYHKINGINLANRIAVVDIPANVVGSAWPPPGF